MPADKASEQTGKAATDAAYPCPQCGHPAVPLSVTTHGPDKVVVHLRCTRCPAEFDAERRTHMLFDKP
jgi:hypothetical protein